MAQGVGYLVPLALDKAEVLRKISHDLRLRWSLFSSKVTNYFQIIQGVLFDWQVLGWLPLSVGSMAR